MSTLKIGFITDPHYNTAIINPPFRAFKDTPGYRIIGPTRSADSIGSFVSTCNNRNVDIAINGGDIVNGPDVGAGGTDNERFANFQGYVSLMGTLNSDIFHAFGHWDVGVTGATGSDYDNLFDNTNGIGTLQPASIENPWWPTSATDGGPVAYTFDKNGFRVIVLATIQNNLGMTTAGEFGGTNTGGTHPTTLIDSNANYITNGLVGLIVTNTTDGSSGTCVSNTDTDIVLNDLIGGIDDQWETGDTYTVGATQQQWFDEVAINTSLPIVLVTHVPIYDSKTGTVNADLENVKDGLEALAIKAVVLQGHVHNTDNLFQRNGIIYINSHGDLWGDWDGGDVIEEDRLTHSIITIENTNDVYSGVTVEGFGHKTSGVIDMSLVANWKLDEPTDTEGADTIIDSKNDNDGTPANAVVSVNGVLGNKAIEFNGTSDIITGQDQLILDYPVTLSAWVRTTSTTEVDALSISNDTQVNRYLSILVNDAPSSGKPSYLLRTSAAKTFVTGTSVINDGQWHHIAGVSASATDHKVYVDGVLENTNTVDKTLPNPLNQWTIGAVRSAATPAEFFDGDIDDARVYTDALTAGQIRAIWEEGAALGHRGRYNGVNPGLPLDRTRSRF
jgi:hypothetical protein